MTVPNWLDAGIVCAYFALALLIGYLARKRSGSAGEYLNASRSLPLWVAALSFLAANCGGLEIVGLSAMSAEFGLDALHFYLVGAIPAMIFLALVMMPVYLRSQARSVPEFLNLRYNAETRLLNAVSLLVISALLAGISLYAMAQTLRSFLGWEFSPALLAVGLLALLFVALGGLKATIYNELLQLALIVAGLTPLAYLLLKDSHGISGLLASLPDERTHLWQTMPVFSPASSMDRVGVIFGLGCVLSLGYWSTDFRQMQRALTTKANQDARLVPLIAASGKFFFPLLVVVPGLAAYRVLGLSSIHSSMARNFDQVLPRMIQRSYGNGLLGLGIVAILACLMSGLAGNIAAFSSLWTQEIYRPYLAKFQQEEHYIAIGRVAMLAGLLMSIATAFIALRFRNLMDYIQFLFSVFNAPLLAVFLLGMFTRWATPWGGFWGLSIGVLAGLSHNIAVRAGWLHYGSQMNANLYGAMLAWSVALITATGVSICTARGDRSQLRGLIFDSTIFREQAKLSRPIWSIALLLIAACVAINVWLR